MGLVTRPPPALVLTKAPNPRSTVALVGPLLPNWPLKFTRISARVPVLPPVALKPAYGVKASWQCFPSALMAMRTVLLQVPPAFTCTGTEQPVGASVGTVKLIWSWPALPGARPLYATLASLPPTHTCTGVVGTPTGGD